MTTLTNNSAIASICIQDLAAYNNGYLIFEWVNLPVADDELQEAVNRVLKKGEEVCCESSHEEIMLADYESDFLDITEFSDPFLINIRANELKELCGQDLKKYRYQIKSLGYNHDMALQNLDDCDIYENISMIELAEHFVDEGLYGAIPDSIINYIDYERIARDLEMDYTEFEGDIYRAN